MRGGRGRARREGGEPRGDPSQKEEGEPRGSPGSPAQRRLEVVASRPGGDLCVVTLAGPEGQPRVRNIIDGQLGPGHVHGMDLWWDADRIVFGYARKDSNEPPEGWNDRRTNHRLRETVEPTRIMFHQLRSCVAVINASAASSSPLR